MNLISSIARGALTLRADAGGTPAPWDDAWYGHSHGAAASGMRVSPESAKRLSTMWACLSARGRIPATMPCKLFTDVPGGGKKLVRNHPVYRLVSTAPNHLQTPYEFFEMLQGHIDLRGNAYCEKIFNRVGELRELMPMHPDRVKVEVLKDSGKLRYVYSDPLSGQDRRLVQEEVFHPRAHCDVTGIGQSRIKAGRDLIGVGLGLQDYHGKFLKNDATPNVVITGTNFETKQDEEAYRAAWQTAGTGENRHKVKLLPPGIDVKTIGVSMEDMQALDSEKANDVRICTLMGVLPHVVGVDAGKAATYASVEQFNIMHAVQCGLPIIIMWEQALFRDLIGDDEDLFFKFSMASLLRGDQATRYAAYAVAIANGWMSQDDVRELEDLNPIPNGWGKNYWRPMNWAPLQQVKALPAPGGGSSNDSDQDGNEDADDEDGSGGDQGDAVAREARLQLLASSAAERCVRREVSGVRKLIDAGASLAESVQFYAEQYRFVMEVFHFEATSALVSKQSLDKRAQQLALMLDQEQIVEAKAWIDAVALSEPQKLATLAAEGVR